MPLNDRQAAFSREYLIDYNATQAAIRAGYSARTAGSQGHDLLKKPEIQAALKNGQKRLSEKTETEAEWVRRRLKEEADDFTESASHSARIRALELLGKVNGIFAKDNEQSQPKLPNITRIELVGVRPTALTGLESGPARGSPASRDSPAS